MRSSSPNSERVGGRRRETIGICASKPKAEAAGASAATLSVRRLTSSSSSSINESEPDIKMKGLFKSKPRTPVDIVRQTRDLLIYANRTSDIRESKREEKVFFFFNNFFNFLKLVLDHFLFRNMRN